MQPGAWMPLQPSQSHWPLVWEGGVEPQMNVHCLGGHTSLKDVAAGSTRERPAAGIFFEDWGMQK